MTNVNYHLPLHLICNPYFLKIKLLDTQILKKEITINKSDIIYVTINNIFNSIDYDNVDDINKNKDINKQINNLTTNNFELIYKFEDYKQLQLNTLLLNNDEKDICDKLLNKYNQEYNRVLLIKQNFINNYIDATKLKKAHLNNNIGCRKKTTSNCDIKNFLNSINNKGNNHTIDSIRDEYLKILHLHNIPIIKINNNHIECCFIIKKMYNLFNDYLHLITYCVNLIELKPYIIRDQSTFLFNFENKNSYFYENENSLCINHMDTIFNISIKENNIPQNGNFVKFLKTPRRNDVLFNLQ